MARYNEVLVGRYNRFIQKLFSMKGPASIPQVAAEIQTVFPFFSGAEHRYLESWNRFAVVTNGPAAGAGNRSGVQLRNPAGSNVIAVVEKITTFTDAAAGVDSPNLQRNVTADLTTIISVAGNRVPDARGNPNSNLILSTNSAVVGAASTGFTMLRGSYIAGTVYEFLVTDIQELPVSPGDGILVLSNTLNQNMIVSLLWRERFLEDSERN